VRRFAIFMGMLGAVPFVLLCSVPLNLTDGNPQKVLKAELWAGVFIALWLACLAATPILKVIWETMADESSWRWKEWW
jgi:NhaP-type Na+/H+ or K+/H+ antiporter